MCVCVCVCLYSHTPVKEARKESIDNSHPTLTGYCIAGKFDGGINLVVWQYAFQLPNQLFSVCM